MERKELLLKLIRELTERDALLRIVNDGFMALERSRLKELSWEIRRIVEEGMQDREEEKEKTESKVEGRKELLLRLCKELTSAVEYLYHEDDVGLKAHLGEVLVRYGSLFSSLGWAITWASEDVQDKVFRVIEDALKKRHLLKCRLEEWLSWKVREIVDEALEDNGEEKETQQIQTSNTDGLPF